MYQLSQLVALAATLSTAMGAYQGFNYGSSFTNGAAKQQPDFEAEFRTAQGLVGAPAGGFTSARLYTMIQGGTVNAPISAIPAAIATRTSLLLGLWASAGDAAFTNELQALSSAIQQYGTALGRLVAGISVGSEDLYRISPTGIENKENPGAAPLTIAHYIKQVRDIIAHTALDGVPVGHVDTWTAWVNSSNQVVVDASDFLGFDGYPYFQKTQQNDIGHSKSLFDDALSATKAASQGKPVWITETGFPLSGKTMGQAVPSIANAKYYWDQVGCPLFGSTNVWWYTMQDSAPATPNPSFGLIGSTLTTTPLFDLSCNSSKLSQTTSSSISLASGVSITLSQSEISTVSSATTFLAPVSSLASNGTMTVASLPSGTSTAASSGKASSIKGSMGDAIAVVMLAMALFGP
ncbi:glycoside hydrolase [Neurospora crassa]|uniref:Probable glucan endo-1,3-beta-glucosidase eglC n=1 Tax=Neurospora crassa (strain ATCC 24698 / 74-OR23-1A / CBS 708.71 / DSM 1257 / FGSC 987) TaxID=367110 RepID=Q7S9G6_NEUCR|nr:GPI-anchored cell wall beta-1,3-endoglucanase EglC [Neurospora crassa OR74A]EAA32983.1 GPI-anchored cell wall beta-1,3-endoglucanase EglC [Neurospora crassa OR74A]KHE85566.1 glycoside hydrolase [Neurospora crassa]|eukprot:XP_962219.1 GPI-anchored cell wall beta-1,3-endoglucanase EglC [Neurospora crassa OR74A]